jgi:isoleucyl-tRNA synthetase/L-amino acid N-acyltransferase YncA
MYKLPSGNLNLASMQNEVLEKWRKEGSFKASISNRNGAEEFVFYDGPPFANGLPHYGHLLTSYIKDSVARFQTMIGKKTERRFGWDCHGLPAEMETEKELKVSGRTQIIQYGVDKFNEACRKSVMKYSTEWQEYIEKAGRWVDFEEDYKTMDTPYMESVLWGFKELYKKGLIYEDFRVMPYSWKCETPLSNFETRMDNSYRSHSSKTAIVKFSLEESPKFPKIKLSALIWTTTPWTLPSNLAIAVGEKIDYVALKVGENEGVIVAKKLASKFEKELGSEVLLEFKGEEIFGLKYKPLFDFFKNHENAFQIIHGDFVEDEGGTGLVHIAPGFGEDDWEVCKKYGIKIVCPVDDAGNFTADLPPYPLPHSERLSFTPVLKKHEGLIKNLLQNHTEMHFEGAESSSKFYQNHEEKFGHAPMIMVLRETGEEIGLAGFLAHNPNLELKEGNIEILCFLKPEYQKKGLGKEAMSFFAKTAFTKLRAKSVIAVIYGKNEASTKMLKSIGFEEAEEVLDPRTNTSVMKFTLSKNPLQFSSQNLQFRRKSIQEFTEEGFTNEGFTNEGFAIYQNSKIIGEAEIAKDTLNFFFKDEVEEDVKMEALKEMLFKFAFMEVKTSQFSQTLKHLGFFETKGEAGRYKRPSDVLNLANKQVFETNEDIISFLKQMGVLIKQEQYIHNYPHCWRTDTPLIYKAVSSWYVEVSRFKERMVELNKSINWMPSHIKDGQFGKWLENARDWSITRNRFWGTPVPVWKVVSKSTGVEISAKTLSNTTLKSFLSSLPKNPSSAEFCNAKVRFESGEEVFLPSMADVKQMIEQGKGEEKAEISWKTNYIFGSIAELEAFFNKKVENLHRPFIDELKITHPQDENVEIVRVSDVLDCWFESGSMPFASIHYPFENKEWFETHNPADFIVEYVAQTRGWFYTLMVLGTAIFDKAPFKNCLCHGVILDANGQKLSKRLRNYPDPLDVFNTFGSDAMRFFLLSSPVVSGGDLNISKDGAEIRDVVRLVIKPIWNAYTFFAMYANADEITAQHSTKSQDLMDRYILSKFEIFAKNMRLNLEEYKFAESCKEIEAFIDVLNNWYIRRNKERFWKTQKDKDKQEAYNTLWTVLCEFAKVISPILPFTAESLYQNLI